MQQPLFECGDTQQFTWSASVAPDAAPLFTVQDSAMTLLASQTAIQSGPLAFYTLYTMPDTPGWYLYKWTAYKTLAGSAYPFVNPGLFRCDQTLVKEVS